MEVAIMMKTNLTKKVAAILAFLAVTVTSVVIVPVDTFAMENNPVDEYATTLYEIGIIGESIPYVTDGYRYSVNEKVQAKINGFILTIIDYAGYNPYYDSSQYKCRIDILPTGYSGIWKVGDEMVLTERELRRYSNACF